ncbi:hypothetical protein JTB14_024590 [Gonioctena quinquepunctata]|nr:hypothetical protein JTB14_024590 [Gonioctena quinquepunctata]
MTYYEKEQERLQRLLDEVLLEDFQTNENTYVEEEPFDEHDSDESDHEEIIDHNTDSEQDIADADGTNDQYQTSARSFIAKDKTCWKKHKPPRKQIRTRQENIIKRLPGSTLKTRHLKQPIEIWKIAKVPFYQVSKIFCLLFIDENPSDLRTIYTALHYAAQHCKETERKTCFVTFDYPLYIKAKQILCNTKDKNLENVVPRLGGFYLLMSYSKAIGTIMEGSGIFELFCTVFAQNLVDKMLSCTAYSRAIRAHMLAMNAIGEIIAEFAESSENIESHKNIEHIKESRPLEAPPSFIRESCSNATDLVELTENADEDEEDDEDESFDYISEIELEKRNAKRLAYERFKRSIFGLEDTDSEEEEGEEDQIEDHAVEETVEVSRTSNVDEPSTSQISPLKKRRKRQI